MAVYEESISDQPINGSPNYSETDCEKAFEKLQGWDGNSVHYVFEAVQYLVSNADNLPFDDIESVLCAYDHGYWPEDLSNAFSFYLIGKDQSYIGSRDFNSGELIVGHFPAITKFTVDLYTDEQILQFSADVLNDHGEEEDVDCFIEAMWNFFETKDVPGLRQNFRAMMETGIWGAVIEV